MKANNIWNIYYYMNTSVKWERRQRGMLWVLVLVSLGFSLYSFKMSHDRAAQAIVYVDALKLMSQYTGMKEAQAALSSRTAQYTANIDTLKAEVSALMEAQGRGKGTGPAVVAAKQRQLAEYQDAVQSKYREENEKLSAELLGKVNDYIKRYGAKKGYTIIMAATHYGNIAYGDKSLDITDEVLTGLNAEYTRVR